MLRKNIFGSLLIVLFCGLFAFGQTAPVRGKVEMQKSDGTKVPVAGALVEVYRTDIKGKFPPAKTDKKGFFNFAGLPFGAVFTFAVSGAGINPELYSNVKAGRDDIVIIVREGSGQKWTEEEVRKALASAPTAAGPGEPVQKTADQKKAEEEYNKAVEATKAKNAKIEETNKIVQDAVDAGNNAFNAKNYDLAVAEYSKGISADPEHPGAPVLLTNKSTALRLRGSERFNASVKAADPTEKANGMAAAKEDFTAAAEASAAAVKLVKAAAIPSDPAQAKNFEASKYNAISGWAESMRLVTRWVDQSRLEELMAAYQEYLAIEADPARKAKAKGMYAQALMDAGDFEKAVAEFEKILAETPENVDALAGAGLCLMTIGYTTNDKATFQKSADYLAKFVELAPDTHKLKVDVKATLDEIKKTQNVAPQKPVRNTGGGKKKP